MNPVHQMRGSVLLVPLKQFIFLAHGERRQAEAADFLMELAALVGVLNRAGRHFIRVICFHCACFRHVADLSRACAASLSLAAMALKSGEGGWDTTGVLGIEHEAPLGF